MSSYVCPRCGNKGSVLLRANQLCSNCMSKWAWGAAGPNQVVTITPEAIAARESRPAAKTQAVKASSLTRVLPIVSLILSLVVVGLLIYFFKQSPTGLPGPQMLNRYSNLATGAVALAALSILLAVSVLYLARRKNADLQASVRLLVVIAIILGTGVFGTAVFCWTKTERVGSLSAPRLGENDLLQRLHDATVVIQAHIPSADAYRSQKREGVIIAAESGRMWILTVPYLDRNEIPIRPPDMWVNLSDGRTLAGQFIWAQREPLNLGIVEVETDQAPGKVQFHPTAEGFIPGQSVFAVPNPLSGWYLEKGTILSRASRRTNLGWNTVVKANLPLGPSDVGSAIYDESGRLLGFMTDFSQSSGESQFVMVDSATSALLQVVRGAKTTGVN